MADVETFWDDRDVETFWDGRDVETFQLIQKGFHVSAVGKVRARSQRRGNLSGKRGKGFHVSVVVVHHAMRLV